MTSLLLICALLIFISAFTSAAEIALFSLSRFQLRSLKERFRSSHRKVKRLLSDPGGLLITILVTNEVVNIALSAIIAGWVSRSRAAQGSEAIAAWLPFSDWAIDTIIGLSVVTPVVLIVCDITPKVIAAKANELFATLTAGPMTVLYDLMKPVRLVLKKVVAVVSRLAGRAHQTVDSSSDNQKPPVLKESEFLLMIEEGHKEGAIHESELELIKNVFELDDTAVLEVLTPLSKLQTLTVNSTLKNSLLTMRGLRYSRIPVLSANRRQVVGIVHSKDLVQAKLNPAMMDETVAAIMRRPLLVAPSVRLNALFRKLKNQKTHMAVVQGPDGIALGVVTMGDVIEALFEDILESPETEATV
jgi:putative hemolysin